MHCLRSRLGPTCIIYDHIHCLRSHALFKISWIDYDHMHCLRAHALFTIMRIVYNHMHCLRSHALFTISCTVYNYMHCMQSWIVYNQMHLFTITCIVYDQLGPTCIVYDHMDCLRSHALFTITCIVYDLMHCLRSHALFTITYSFFTFLTTTLQSRGRSPDGLLAFSHADGEGLRHVISVSPSTGSWHMQTHGSNTVLSVTACVNSAQLRGVKWSLSLDTRRALATAVVAMMHRLLQRCPIRCRERRSSATSKWFWTLLRDSLLVRKSFASSHQSSVMSLHWLPVQLRSK